MEKTCLNCLYEPEWEKWIGKKYRRRIGNCKFKVIVPILPSIYSVRIHHIERYDDSGIIIDCPTWEPKK